MINTLFKKTVDSFNKPTASNPPAEPQAPSPVEPKAVATKPATEPSPIDLSPRDLALRAADAAGWKMGDEQLGAEICRHQPSKRFLMVMVEGWGEPVMCHVKDALSWLPVNPPFNRLTCRFTGTATAEGRLIFESSDLCKAARLRRAR